MKCNSTAFTINNHKRTLRWLENDDNDDNDFWGGARYMRGFLVTDMTRLLRSV